MPIGGLSFDHLKGLCIGHNSTANPTLTSGLHNVHVDQEHLLDQVVWGWSLDSAKILKGLCVAGYSRYSAFPEDYNVYVYVCVYIYKCVCIYIYIYISLSYIYIHTYQRLSSIMVPCSSKPESVCPEMNDFHRNYGHEKALHKIKHKSE